MPADAPIVLDVRGLMVSIRSDEGIFHAVRGADFSAQRGKTLGLVGESGCGKSIAMRAVMGILPRGAAVEPGGRILLRDGRGPEIDLSALPLNGPEICAVRGGRIAMIFQEPTASLSPVYTIGAHLREVLHLHGGLRAAAAGESAADLLDRVGIPNPRLCLRQYPHELSGGMRQRVMIALALAGKPSILIADEPTTALDVTIQAQILDLLRELQEAENMAMIFISHDMGVVSQVADDIAVMYLGRVVESGPTAAVVSSPAHPYTDGLLRATPRIGAHESRLTPIPGDIPGPMEIVPGCPFHPRCSRRIPDVCDSKEPPVFPAERQTVRCFLAEDATEWGRHE